MEELLAELEQELNCKQQAPNHIISSAELSKQILSGAIAGYKLAGADGAVVGAAITPSLEAARSVGCIVLSKAQQPAKASGPAVQ